MGLFGVSVITFALLYGVLAVVLAIAAIALGAPLYMAFLIVVVVIVIQYLIGPWITDLTQRWFYKTDFNAQIPPYLEQFIRETCDEHGVKYPRIGLINDGLLEAPAYKSYNLADYDALVAEAKKKEEESFYISEITDELFERIKGKSFKDDCTISREDLRYLHVLHKDIDGNVKEGEMIVNQYIAEDVLDILKELYKADYPIEKIRLVDEYDADDEASMEDNNSSSFNFRFISHTNKVSKHGLGLAVDINTLYNPYTKVVDGERIIEPVTGEPYLDREAQFPYKIQKGDLCYKLFTEHGFEWGGDWSDRKDYQHFEMPDSVVETLYG